MGPPSFCTRSYSVIAKREAAKASRNAMSSLPLIFNTLNAETLGACLAKSVGTKPKIKGNTLMQAFLLLQSNFALSYICVLTVLTPQPALLTLHEKSSMHVL